MTKNNNKKKTQPTHQLDPVNSILKAKKANNFSSSDKTVDSVVNRLEFMEGKVFKKNKKFNTPLTGNINENVRTIQEVTGVSADWTPPKPDKSKMLPVVTEVDDIYEELTNKIKHLEELAAVDAKHFSIISNDNLARFDNLHQQLEKLNFKFYVFVGLTIGIFIVSNLYNWLV